MSPETSQIMLVGHVTRAKEKLALTVRWNRKTGEVFPEFHSHMSRRVEYTLALGKRRDRICSFRRKASRSLSP